MLTDPGRAVLRRLICCALLLTAFASAADPPIAPVTVCEILTDLAAHEGKDYAVLGRYSFRRDGRWIGQDACGASKETTGEATTPMLWLDEDSSAAPKPPGDFELDGAVLNK